MAKKRHSIIPASYLVLMKKNKILLLKRFNTGYEDGKYSMIAGHVDPNESFSKTIIREAYEEANIKITPKDIKIAHIMHRKALDGERIDVFFVCKKWKGDVINKEPHKCSALSWFDIKKHPANIIPYLRHVLKDIQKEVFYSEYGWSP
jgi:ADP-ribose pyrophosphatase YjhB (NUDIX family)